jgi:hypothetical protein
LLALASVAVVLLGPGSVVTASAAIRDGASLGITPTKTATVLQPQTNVVVISTVDVYQTHIVGSLNGFGVSYDRWLAASPGSSEFHAGIVEAESSVTQLAQHIAKQNAWRVGNFPVISALTSSSDATLWTDVPPPNGAPAPNARYVTARVTHTSTYLVTGTAPFLYETCGPFHVYCTWHSVYASR